MSRLGINTGSSPNDGQGDSLRVAMGKINSNFTEVYDTFGDGNNLISYASTSGISTLARNLTGSPRINVSGVLNSGITTTEHLEVRNITSTGVVTATQFVGDGSQLTNVTALVGGLEVLDDNVRKGVARELNFGANIVSTGPDGVGRVTISVGSSIIISGIVTTANYASVAGYSTASGISTVAQGLTGTPNLNVGVVTATSYRGSGANLTGIITTLVAGSNVTIDQSSGIATISASGSAVSIPGINTTGTSFFNQLDVSRVNVSGVSTFQQSVNFESSLLIGDNDELQIFHDGVNSYIDNSSGGNLILRDSGLGIQLRRSGGGPGAGLMANFNTGAGVELYYDSLLKLQTFQNGVAINDSVGIGSTAGNPPYRLTVSGIGATITQGLANAIADFTSSVNGYGQLNVRNSLSGTNASGDVVVTADTGNDASNFIDLGINNTGFTTTTWTINGALDGYLYTSDGNLSIGAASASKYVSIFAGGTLAANEQVRVTTSGVGIGTTNATSKLTVTGDARISGVVTANSFRPSSGYIQAADGTNSFYIYNTSGNVAFQGTIGASQVNSASGYKAFDFGATTTPSVNITNSLNVGSGASISGVVTATSFSGSGTNLTGIITTLVAGTNVTINQSSGIATINASGGGGSTVGIDTTGTSFFNQLNVSGVSTFSGITTNTSTLFANQLSVSGVSTFAGITTVTGVSLFSRQLSVSGVSTFAGITTVTGDTLFTKQFNVSGLSTFAGITTVTGVTLFTKQLNASGVATALSFVGAGTSLTGLDASNISLGTLTNSRLPSNISVSGVVTATRFESTSGGTPTIGAATTISLETIKVAISTDVTVGRNANVSGIVTATGGFISVGNTTPIQISLVGNQLTFTAVGIGSTTLTLF